MREQHLYARWLRVGTRIGLVILVASFLAYVLGLVEPLIAPQEVVRLWSSPAHQYVAGIRGPTGWGWLGHLGKGDYLNYLGVALLASITIACYARIIPVLPRVQAALAALQILVLLVAMFL